ncbi:MAG: hypothetical protein ABI844_12720 [Saprospiraceae bacterium]
MENRKYTLTETIMGLVMMAAVLWAALYLFKGIFKILAWAAPVMFIAALIINYKVVLSYGKMLIVLLQKNLIYGIIATVLTFFAFPIVAAVLLGLTILNKKADNFVKQEQQKKDGFPTDFREISSTPRSGYDDIFKSS